MLSVSNISKSFGIKTVLQGVSFTIKHGERMGLVGPNGCGKTTLMRILAGYDKPDSGSVQMTPSSARIAYLPQGFPFETGESIFSFINRMQGDLPALSQRLEYLADSLAKSQAHLELQKEYDSILARLETISQNPDESIQVLTSLGLSHIKPDTPVSHLSGGQKTRLSLAGVLLLRPQFLLLDEPTNHLDIQMLEWLEDWLVDFSGTVLVISHDRAFLDNTTTGIIELDPVTHTSQSYEGNYSDYLEQKVSERGKQWQQYSDQCEEISHLKSTAARLRGVAHYRKGSKADTGDKFLKGFLSDRSKGTVGRAKNVERRIEQLLTNEHIEKPRQTWQMKIEFSSAPSSGRDVLVLDDLAVGYNQIPLLEHIQLVLHYGQRVALIGPNGAGKTTLVRTIAGLLPPITGNFRLGSQVQIGYMSQEQEELNPFLNALQAINPINDGSETEARSFLSKFLFKGDDVFTPASEMSYGERARLSLALMAKHGCNLLLLDEPINHLDIPARIRFEEALSSFEGTILAVVHDRYFIQAFATSIWEVNSDTVQIIA